MEGLLLAEMMEMLLDEYICEVCNNCHEACFCTDEDYKEYNKKNGKI